MPVPIKNMEEKVVSENESKIASTLKQAMSERKPSTKDIVTDRSIFQSANAHFKIPNEIERTEKTINDKKSPTVCGYIFRVSYSEY